MRVEHEYDVSPPALLDVLTDGGFLAARSARFGGKGDPSVDRVAGRIVVTVPRHLPVEAIPGPFRRFAGNGELIQTDVWSRIGDDRISGTWTTDTGDSPLRLAGTYEITATDGGCRYVVTAEVEVKIRFVGGQAEAIVGEQLATLVRKEQEFAQAWLSGPR